MNTRLDKLLCKEHPLLFAQRHADVKTTAMCWGFECGDGWYGIIKEAADQLEPLIQATGHPEDHTAVQIKEKYGTLCIYMSAETEEMSKIIRAAEEKSIGTCERCGRPGRLRGRGWYYTACAKHVQKDL